MTDVMNDVHAGRHRDLDDPRGAAGAGADGPAEKFVPRFSSKYLDFTSQRAVEWYARTSRITPSGVFGDPTRATREKGERMWEIMIHHLVELVISIQGLSLDEIYQRRY